MNYDAQEQYQRLIRLYEALRVLATDIGKTVVIGDYAAKDATRTFFIESHHLKDWLKKDARIKNEQDVEDFIKANHALKLGAILCNSLKHAGLDYAHPSGMQLDQINMAYSMDIPNNEQGSIACSQIPSDGDTVTITHSNRTGSAIATAKVVLTISGQKHDALSLATQCVRDWDVFLAAQGIKFAKS